MSRFQSLAQRSARAAWLLPIAALGGAFVTAFAYWPGLMSWDPVHQYGQALSGRIDDWHPAAMQWLWRQLIRVYPGPAPMLILQLLLYWGGLVAIATALHPRRSGLAWMILACGALPLGLALTGMIFKDCLMAGALLVATGVLAHRQNGASRLVAASGVAILFLAATLRFNAFIACAPLLVALLPHALWRTWPRLILTSLVAVAALIAAMPVANHLISAAPSDVELSLVIFDLGGITDHTQINVFPDDLAVPDAVAVNHTCYRPARWDSYSDWVAPECPIGFTAWKDNVDPTSVHPYRFWLSAIAHHPIAYAEHRLGHFAFNTRIRPLADTVERPVPATGAPNPWGFHTEPNVVGRAIDALAIGSAHTPLGWPIVWIALAVGTLIASWGLPSARLIAPIALSSMLYGMGYLAFSVASELRYHLWTELAALLAVVLALADPSIRERRRLIPSFVPAFVAVLAGIAMRVAGG